MSGNQCSYVSVHDDDDDDDDILKLRIYWDNVRNVDRLCGLVVRVPDYRSRDPRFYSRRYQIF
jgi:hypothetical protein